MTTAKKPGSVVAPLPPADAATATASWRRNMLAGIETLQNTSHANFRPFLAPGSVSHDNCTCPVMAVSNGFSCAHHVQGHCMMSFDNALKHAGFADWLGTMLGTTPNVTPSTLPPAHNCGPGCRLSGVIGCDGVVGSRVLEDRCGV